MGAAICCGDVDGDIAKLRGIMHLTDRLCSIEGISQHDIFSMALGAEEESKTCPGPANGASAVRRMAAIRERIAAMNFGTSEETLLSDEVDTSGHAPDYASDDDDSLEDMSDIDLFCSGDESQEASESNDLLTMEADIEALFELEVFSDIEALFGPCTVEYFGCGLCNKD